MNYGNFATDKHMKNQDFMQLTDYQIEKQRLLLASNSDDPGRKESVATPDYNFLEHICNTPYSYSGMHPFSVRLPRL